MKYIKAYESYKPDTELIDRCLFIKVPTGGKTIYKPAFGAKKGTTDFYQLLLDDEIAVEIEVSPLSSYGGPEIMSAYSNIRGKGLGEYLVNKVLDIYLKDELFVRATKGSKNFWERVGASVINKSDKYLLHFTK